MSDYEELVQVLQEMSVLHTLHGVSVAPEG
jgi:hypothetical protein